MGTSKHPKQPTASVASSSPAIHAARNQAKPLSNQPLGNRAVAKLFRSASSASSVPTNLTISSPNDPAEFEADRIAAEVMRMRDDDVPRSIETSSSALHRKCAACEDEEQQKIHRSATAESPGTAPPIVTQLLSQPGQPLPASTRSFFEPRLGADLSGVRIHTDTQAARSADAVHAKAYTVANSIAFANGHYSPQSESGKSLLAHELVHVVQQGETLQREPDSPAGMTSGTAPASVVAPPEPAMAAPDTSKIDQLLKALEADDWNVDTLAAELTDAEMRSLKAAVRLRLIRAVSGGMIVGDEDETTIIRLLVTTPDGQAGEIVKGLDPALLRQLEGAIDGDEYKLYQVQLGKLFWRALTPDQAALLTANGKVFPWANPGLLEGTQKGRVSYEKIEINDQGKIVIKYYFVAPYMPALALAQGPFELDPMQVIGVYFLQAEEYAGMEAGQLTYMPAINLLALYNKLFRQAMGLVTDVALLGLGGAGVVGATTKLGRVVAVLEVAVAAADVGIREYRRDIARTEDGKAFLNVWDRVQFLLMIYDGVRLAMTVPTIFRSLRSVWIRWRAAATGAGQEASIRRVQDEVESVLRQSDEVERAAAESPPKAGQTQDNQAAADVAPTTVPEPLSSQAAEGMTSADGLVATPAEGLTQSNVPQVKGIGPTFQSLEDIDALMTAGKIHDGAHVLGVFVRNKEGKIVARWFEVSEKGVGVEGAKLLGHTEQKALQRIRQMGLETGSSVEFVGSLQPCNFTQGCSRAMTEFAQTAGMDVRYRHVYGVDGTTIHEFTELEGRITQKDRKGWVQ